MAITGVNESFWVRLTVNVLMAEFCMAGHFLHVYTSGNCTRLCLWRCGMYFLLFNVSLSISILN